MESSIFKQIGRFLQEKKKEKRWLVAFVCMAIIVGFGTVTALKLRGQAMTHKEKSLVCQLEVHEHTDECYDEAEENLICGYADYVVHVHNDDCYDWNGNLTCTLPEVEKHEHDEECYTEEETLVCGQEEAEGHTHTEECYTRRQGELICQYPEHQHDESCYDENGEVLCGMEEHGHMDECYEWLDELNCQLAEGEDGHKHEDSCYETEKVLSCGKLELHTHTDDCYEKIDEEKELSEENRRLICVIPVLEEHVHTEESGCFEIVEVTANGEVVEEDAADAKDENEKEVFTTDLDGEKEDAENAEHADDGKEDTENKEDTKKYDETKSYEGEGYIVKASYNKDANIPENAELVAEQITEENDEETFSQHAAEFQNMMEDKNNTMEFLFKIGFYVDGEEVEPESPVLITIQLLDENGLPESAPVTVVHFGDGENQLLDGSEVENGSTSFETGSFSYFGIRAEPHVVDGKVHVSETFEYKSDLFQVNFQIEGDAVLLEEDDNVKKAEENSSSKVRESMEQTEEPSAESNVVDLEDDSTEKNPVNEEDTSSDEEPKMETDTDALVGDSEDQDSEVIQGSEQKFQLQVNVLDESSKEYEMVNAYAKKKGEQGELFQMQVLSYSLSYDDIELDLSECKVTAEVIPGEELIAQAEEIVSDEKEQKSMTLTTYELDEDTVNKAEDKLITDDTLSEPVVCTLNNSKMAVRSSIVEDPEFTVQYYAYMQVVKTEKEASNDSIKLIDTSAAGNGKENAVIPVNGDLNLKTINIKVKDSGELGDIIDPKYHTQSNKWDIVYENKLTKVYSEQTFKMMQYPELNNVDKFAVKDPHYQLKEVWEWTGEKDDERINSTESEGWTIYQNLEELKFTNNPDIKEKEPKNTILMGESTIIRLVADSTPGAHNNDAAFYDYDITDGEVYSDKTLTTLGDRKSDGTLYANIKRQGINSSSNYENDTESRYGFGNINTAGTGIENDKSNGNYINKANNSSLDGCSFGLVGSQLTGDGSAVYPQFNVNAPKLFGSGGEMIPVGETAIAGFSLDFKRIGDTYTLTAVNGSSTAVELERFQHRMNWNGQRKLWTNNFWPMDSSVETYGTQGHDLAFGELNKKEKRVAVGVNQSESFPIGDDGKDHNSYFAMNFAVDFELTEDYVGPLNYYFFGDDDMWVYLCPINEDGSMNIGASQLVCDIGGVHSSVGEYVNLRDYLPDKTAGKYALVFFYTERGASGSTCWMQYTLPSVNTRPVTQITGDLKNTLTVSKTVDGPVPAGQEFEFEIEFKDEKGVDRINCYAYKIVETGTTPEKEVKSGTIQTGDSFFLAKGQSIVVRNLPDKTTYTIKEKNFGGYRPAISGSGEVKGEGVSEGEIDWDDDEYQEIEYVNVYSYELPETGGSGIIIYTMAGVLVILLGAGFMYRKKVRERRV